MILAPGFEEIEAITPIDALKRAGIEITIAGLNDIEVKSAREVIIKADCLLDDVSDDFDAVILPGGGDGAKNLAASEKVKELVLKQNEQAKIIAAICASPAVVLHPLGILSMKRMTCFPGCEENLDPDVFYMMDSVVVDDHLITSDGPAHALEFSLMIIKALLGDEMYQKIGKATLYL
ncbi:hypothetical protein BVX93_01740 [bacterium B13(2017)]|nr:hypothetical protein BVX93_01740 [bacterium B13(2017)]